MKVFICEEINIGYGKAMALIAANSKEEAVKLLKEYDEENYYQFDYNSMTEYFGLSWNGEKAVLKVKGYIE